MASSRPTPAQRMAVTARTEGCCEYCQSPEIYSPSTFALDHVRPVVGGGPTQLDNLALACLECNNRKYAATEAVDPADGSVVPLFSPRRDNWVEHFQWSDNLLYIIGRTPTGRATVERLQLNRLGVINLRRVLRDAGIHPRHRFGG
jgi:hypothetical protein